ncbi:predicted protein [Scheffersomyces stipitis CBS 6054]|uniref:Uncharacterized protein n=1 Tax=Scheffersomyces stipitis (strain ATCC 58785 / CBS 6054 / NBRC 10063 / NRRL Y-11545) TaxID=322104 RepID=A3LVZ1_PICST|nr:predicted protein [Scheffersomyces stipitis CBS 6054]ABN66867.1 predicted protein [Scheffersomyces stipitis CBS 6054]KAG2734456.1 hypothetical protein G9P44_002462 [Scheffersomyces stipitis]
MVTINYEPLEHLPYLDESISPEERSHVEQLIRVELTNQFSNQNLNNINFHPNPANAESNINNINTHNSNASRQNPLHPMVDQILPLPQPSALRLSPSPLLNQEIERYEQEQLEEFDDDDETALPANVIHGGIDMNRYADFIKEGSSSSGGSEVDRNNLYTTLSYAGLQERNLALLLNNNHELMRLHQQHLQELGNVKEDYTVNLNSKRQMVDEVNVIRKKRQVVNFKPVNDYLNEKWKEGIKSVVDLGIEATRMDMDMN